MSPVAEAERLGDSIGTNKINKRERTQKVVRGVWGKKNTKTIKKKCINIICNKERLKNKK